MTTERRPAARPPAWPVMAGGAGAFLAALAFLAGQVREGRDAALGPAEPVASPTPRVVIVRRVLRRVVIDAPKRPARARAAPVVAPAPVAAPAAPAPAPAPLTTRSS
jgi:hypothetical protein